jgi:hypothetical protein
LRQKCKIEVKVECVMQNKQIDVVTTDHSPTPLPEQERMQALDVEEMESSSKIDLRDVLWWMSIKNACRLEVPIIAKRSKEGCISLAVGRKLSHVTHKHDKSRCGPPLT